jgi:transcriptional regulator with XRE-family HTH domain
MEVKDFKTYFETRLDKNEIQKLEYQAEVELEALKALQEDVSRTIAAYIAKEHIGFNELVRRLGISSSKVSRIQKGEANLTLANIARISSLLHRKAKIIFE